MRYWLIVACYLQHEDVARSIVIAISTSGFLHSLFWMLLIYSFTYVMSKCSRYKYGIYLNNKLVAKLLASTQEVWVICGIVIAPNMP